jgi:hypothetical protein
VHWSAAYFENDDGFSRMNLQIDMTDIYGNLITNFATCDYYWHDRLIFYAEIPEDFGVFIDQIDNMVQYSILFTELQTK